MLRFFLALALSLAPLSGALAQTGVASGMTVTATGGTTARTTAARAADVINVLDYGADPTDTNDSTAAINAAFAALRAKTNTLSTVSVAGTLVIPYGTYKILGSINATALRGQAITIKADGAVIDCQATGLPCIDGLNIRYNHWEGLTVVGSATNTPTIGMQIGHLSGVVADDNTFQNMVFSGKFSFTSFYNFASETSKFDKVLFWNNAAGPNAFALVQDGYNHWGVTSTFTPQTAPADTASSFNEDVFVNCDFREQNGGPAIWMARTNRHRYIGGYIGDSVGTNTPAVMMYTLAGDNGFTNDQLDFDVHIETAAVGSVFQYTGTNATPQTIGIKYHDQGPQVSQSIFSIDSGSSVTSVSFYGAVMEIGPVTSGVKLFDTPANWSGSGNIWLPSGAFNATSWSGTVCVALSCTTGGVWGTGSETAQIADSAATGGNARGANSVDLQTARSAAGNVASGQFAALVGGTSNTASGQGSAVIGGNGNTASGTFGFIGSGKQTTDRGRLISQAFGAGQIAVLGDAQAARFVLSATCASCSSQQLTSSHGATTATTVANIANNQSYNMAARCVARDETAAGTDLTTTMPVMLLSRDATVGSTALVAGTPASVSRGTWSGGSFGFAADATNGGLNISFTSPTGNTDTFHAVCEVVDAEVQ